MLKSKIFNRSNLILSMISILLCLLAFFSSYGLSAILGKENTVWQSLSQFDNHQRVLLSGKVGFDFPDVANEDEQNYLLKQLLESGLTFDCNGNFSYANSAYHLIITMDATIDPEQKKIIDIVISDKKAYISSLFLEDKVMFYDFADQLPKNDGTVDIKTYLQDTFEIVDKYYLYLDDQNGINERYLAVDYKINIETEIPELEEFYFKLTTFHNMENEIKRFRLNFLSAEEEQSISFYADIYLDWRDSEKTFAIPKGELLELSESDWDDFNQAFQDLLAEAEEQSNK